MPVFFASARPGWQPGSRSSARMTGGRRVSPLLWLADRLFGGDEPRPAAAGRWLLRYLGVATLLAGIIVIRRPDAVTNPQFWAEDGYIFFYENLALGFPRALAKMYFGFPYLAHRLIAFAGGLVPFADAPRVYATGAIAITALGLATFALPGFRHLVRSDALRVLFGVAVVSAPSHQGDLATLTNVGWFIAIWVSLLSLMPLPRRPWAVALVALVGSAAVLATPLAALNAPLWVLRGWRGIRRRDWRDIVFAAALLTTFGFGLAVTRGLGSEKLPGALGTYPFATHPLPYIRRYLNLTTAHAAAFMVPRSVVAAVAAAGRGAVAGTAAVVGIGLVAAVWAGRWRSLPMLLAAMALFAGAFVVLFVGRPKYLYLPSWRNLPLRYTVYPSAMFSLAVLAVVDALPRRTRYAVGVTLLALVGWTWSASFVVSPFVDHDWPRYAGLLEAKIAAKSHEPLHIPMNPPWTPLDLDMIDWFPRDEIPSSDILGGLGLHGTFQQSFVSRCDRLARIEMHLGAMAGSGKGDVAFSLLGEPSGTVVESSTVARTDMPLEGTTWQSFAFPPLEQSAGKRYTIKLRAENNDPDASVWILGARGDPYPDGVAMEGTKVLDADASFRYGCARRSGTLP